MLKLLDACGLVVFWIKFALPEADRPSAVVALAELRLRIEYGLEAIGWRGLSVVKVELLVGLTAISRKRAAPLKQLAQAPKSSCTVKMPDTTVTGGGISVGPCCVPVPTVAVSKSLI